MTHIRVEAASSVPWSEVEHALTGGGDGGSCWCQWFTIPRADFRAKPGAERRDLLMRELASAPVSPGLVAFVDDASAGWMRVGPRTMQPTLLRGRIVQAGSPQSPGDPDVWAITCFVVRREFRGIGVARRLVEAGLEFAASHGARLVEAYPFDVSTGARRANELFVGTVGLFEGAGFTETARPTGARVVMTLDLATDRQPTGT